MRKRSEEQKQIQQLLNQKAKLVKRNLELEIESRIIERKLSMIGTKINALIGEIVEEKPTMNQEELRLAQINRYGAAQMLRRRFPEMSMQEALSMVDTSLGKHNTKEVE